MMTPTKMLLVIPKIGLGISLLVIFLTLLSMDLSEHFRFFLKHIAGYVTTLFLLKIMLPYYNYVPSSSPVASLLRVFLGWLAFLAFGIFALISGFINVSTTIDRLTALDSLKNNPSVISLPPSKKIDLDRASEIDYSLDLAKEKYYVFAPKSEQVGKKFGLIVLLPQTNEMTELPCGWEDVLRRRHYVLIAPEAANGFGSDENRRMGLAVLGALSAIEKYNIDSSKIYVTGMSDGAALASDLAFLQPDLFTGTIQIDGCDFYQKVDCQVGERQIGSEQLRTCRDIRVPVEKINAAKKRERFVLLIRDKNDTSDTMQDIYNNGFIKQGFNAKLIQEKDSVPAFQFYSPAILSTALDYLESIKK